MKQYNLGILIVIIFSLQNIIKANDLPNIVFFIADDLGVYHTSAYGAEWISTPNIKFLSEQGMKFNRAYVASPSCVPSRAALMTGLMPYKNGIVGNHEKVRKPNVEPLLPILIDLGYEIVWLGKVGHGPGSDSGNEINVIETEGFRPQPKELEVFLKNRKSNRPIIIFFGTRYPHRPWPEQDNVRIKPNEVEIPEKTFDTYEARMEISRYVEAVEIVDRKFGEIEELIKKYLKTNNTITIFTSDNGQAWPFAKWDLYETGIRTPLLIRWPNKIKPKSVSDAMVSWIDLIPTIIDIAGGKIPWEIDGISFKENLIGKKLTHRDKIFGVHKGDNNWNVYPIRSVRNDKWKYIYNIHPEFYRTTHMDLVKKESKFHNRQWRSWVKASNENILAMKFLKAYHTRPKEELYRVDVDSFEYENLANNPKYKSVVKKMRKILFDRMKRVGDDQSLSGKPRFLKDYSFFITN